MNVIYTKLAKLENQIQNIGDNIQIDEDKVQLDVPEYDPDIDGLVDPRPQQNSVVVSVQEAHNTPDSGTIDAINSEEESTGRD